MIIENGTSAQLCECAFQACLPKCNERWGYFRPMNIDDAFYRNFVVKFIHDGTVWTDPHMIDFSVESWVLLVAEGRLRLNPRGTRDSCRGARSRVLWNTERARLLQ